MAGGPRNVPAWLPYRFFGGLFGGLSIVLAILAMTWAKPAPLSIDEVTYHRMTQSLLDGRGFAIWNGYEELPSPELETRYTTGATGHLVAQYPYGGPIAAAPTYAAFGIRGLIVINVLAMLGAIALSYRIGVQLFADRWIALLGATLVAVATFAFDYALAIWPHALALVPALAALSLSIRSSQMASGTASLRWSASAGVAIGLALTVRLDVLFFAPALVAPFLFMVPTRWRELLAMAAGTVPGLSLNLFSNWARWGSLAPVSYGGSISPLRYWPFIVAALVIVAAAWGSSRPAALSGLRGRLRSICFVAGMGLLLVVVEPSLRRLAVSIGRGLWAIAVDLRALPANQTEAAMSRVAGGAIMYDLDFKKGLVQSVAFVPLVGCAFFDMMRVTELRWRIAWLFVVPTVLVGFFGVFAWHGGLALNQRYLLPSLPFIGLLSAYGLRRLSAGNGAASVATFAGGVGLGLAMYWSLRASIDREVFVLDFPLGIATILGLLVLAWHYRSRRVTALTALAIAGIACAWSASAGVEDTRWSHRRRGFHAVVSKAVGDGITDDSLLFASFPDPFYAISEQRPRVRIAIPNNDDFVDAPRLIQFHLAAGRRVYGALTTHEWRRLKDAVSDVPLVLKPISGVGPYWLAELVLSPPPGSDQ